MSEPRLIVLRGNSGSGKSSVAEGIRRAYGRGVAWVEQDYVRRIMLHELEAPEAVNVAMIEQIAITALRNGFHTVVEGIFHTRYYGAMLARLAREHTGPAYFYYFDIPLEETIRRHATRPKATAFGPDALREWYRPRDLLATPPETILDHTATLAEIIDRIVADTGLK